MQFSTAHKDDIPRLKKLWIDNFDDGTKGFCDFLFSVCTTDKFYVAKEDDAIVSMLVAIRDLAYGNKKGFYIYSACTEEKYRNKGYMTGLIKFSIEDMKNKGYDFCILKPATERLFDFYKKIGFESTIQMRKAEIEIKRNIWQTAEFDIATSSRLKTIREKYCDNLVRYAQKDYEKYAMYLYSFGGSTAENENAFAVYYIEKDKLVVKEILSDNSVYAMKLLQAVRERTGCETATVYLSKDSNLFLGEGKIEDSYMVYGLDNKEPYINLMFE